MEKLYGSLSQEFQLNGTLQNEEVFNGNLANDILRGYSAYQVACLNGFVGTEKEWLESLKGQLDADFITNTEIENIFR